MTNFRSGSTLIALPDPAAIPVPKTRAALEHLLAIRERVKGAARERDAADARARDAENAERIRLGDLYDADPDAHDENLGDAVEDAKRAARDAQRHLSGLTRAEEQALAALRIAITEERDQWRKTARSDAAQALGTLTTATSMAEQARSELTDTLGVLRTLGEPGRLVSAGRPNGYEFGLNPGIDGLHEALAAAAQELREQRP